MLQRGRAAGRAADGDELDAAFARRRRLHVVRRDVLFFHDAAPQVLHADVGDLQHFGDEIALDLFQPRRNASARLGDEIDRAELERLEDAAVAGARRDRDHRRRQIRHQPAQEGEAVHHRHLQIERDDVRPMPHHLLDAVLAVDRRATTSISRRRRQHPRDRHAVVRGIVDDEGTERHHFWYTMSFFRCRSLNCVESEISDSEWPRSR